MKTTLHSFLTIFLVFCASMNLKAQVFTVDKTEGCIPLTVNINITYSDTLSYDYTWYLNEDVISNFLMIKSIILDQPGQQTLTLERRIKGYPFPENKSDIMIYARGANAKISVYPDTLICPNQDFELYTEMPNTNDLEWHVQNGPIKYNTNGFNFRYSKQGDYKIKLYAYSSECGVDSSVQIIHVGLGKIPLPEIFVDRQSVCINDIINFSIYSMDNNLQAWHWNFGDGSVSDENQPNHAFTKTGDYKVVVRVTNQCGQVGFDTAHIQVTNGVSNDYIDFNYDYPLCPDQTIKFNPYGNVGSKYLWDFGDGGKSQEKSPYHVFKQAGQYQVALMVQNGCGIANYTRKILFVGLDSSGNIDADIKIAFNNEDDNLRELSICPGATVQFDNQSWYNTNLKYFWTFGNGDSSYAFNPKYTFKNEGEYYAKFTLIDGCGFTKSDSLYINVQNLFYPQTSLKFVPDTICPGDSVYFWDELYYNNDSPYKNIYSIKYGDGNSSNNITKINETNYLLASHAYAGPGPYGFEFIAKNQCNKNDTLKDTIIVDPDASRKSFYYWGHSLGFDSSNYELESGEKWLCQVGDSMAFVAFMIENGKLRYHIGYTNDSSGLNAHVISEGAYQKIPDGIILIDNGANSCNVGPTTYFVVKEINKSLNASKLYFSLVTEDSCEKRQNFLLAYTFHLMNTVELAYRNYIPADDLLKNLIYPITLGHGGAMAMGDSGSYTCGDVICDPGEEGSCPGDCPFICGNSNCEPGVGENPGNCSDCLCPDGTTWDPDSMMCVSVCSPGEVWNPDSMMCISVCAPGETWNPDSMKCVSVCSPGEAWNPDSMMCLSVCALGETWDYDSMKCVSVCSPGEYWNPDSMMCLSVCAPGEYWNTDSMKCVSVCSPGEAWNPDSMMCLSVCAPGETWDYDSMKCVSVCAPGEAWNPDSMMCLSVCAPGETWDYDSMKCISVCAPGEVWVDSLQTCMPSGPQCNNNSICEPGLGENPGNCSDCQSDIISNGSFDDGTNYWIGFYNNIESTAYGSFDASGNMGYFNITDGGSLLWHVQLIQYISLVQGKNYALSFKAMANMPRNIEIQIRESSTYTQLYTFNVNISDVLTQYGPFNFNPTISSTDRDIVFNIGGSSGEVWFDDISIAEQSQESVCGNKNCEPGENWQSCPYDCPAPPDSCGNGTCEPGEDTLCPGDCKGKEIADWSISIDAPNEYHMNTVVQFPEWTADPKIDTAFLIIWYGIKDYIHSDPGQPDGMVKFILNPASPYTPVTAHIPANPDTFTNITYTAVWSKDGFFNQSNDAYGIIPKYSPIMLGDTISADTVTIIYGSSDKIYYNENDPNYFIQIKKSYEADSLKLYQIVFPDTSIILQGVYDLAYDQANHYDVFMFTNFAGIICSYPADYIFSQSQNGMMETVMFTNIDDDCPDRYNLFNGINYNTRPECPAGHHYDTMLGYCVLNSNPGGIPDWSILHDSINEYHMNVKVLYPEWHTGINDTAFVTFYYGYFDPNNLTYPSNGMAPVQIIGGQGIVRAHIPVNMNSQVSISACWNKDSTLSDDMNAYSDVVHWNINPGGVSTDTILLTLVFKEKDDVYLADLDTIMGFFKLKTLIDVDSFYLGTATGWKQVKSIVSFGVTSYTYDDQLNVGQINLNGTGGLCGISSAQYPFTYNNDLKALYFYTGTDPCNDRETLLSQNTYYLYDTTKCPINYAKDKFGRCYLRPTCPDGYVWDAMSSSCIPQCGKNYYWDGYECRPNQETRNGCPNDTVVFQVLGALQAIWDFGDTSGTASGSVVKHIYSKSGVYNAFAVVKNGCNRTDTLWAKVVIDTISKPFTDFDLSFYQAMVKDTLFTKYYGNDGQVDNNKYLWVFGDGATSNEREPIHIYEMPGDYTLTLQVTNGCGTAVGQRTLIIMPSGKEISNEPYADAGQDTSIRGGQSIILDGTKSRDVSGGLNITYDWVSLDNMILENPTTPTPIFTAPYDINKDIKDFIFVLTVTDTIAGKTSSDFVVVSVSKPAGDNCMDPMNANTGINHAVFPKYSYDRWFIYYPLLDGKLTVSNCGKSDQNTQLNIYDDCFSGSTGYFSNTCGNNVTAEFIVNTGHPLIIAWNVSTSGGELAKSFDFDLTFTPFSNTDFISYSIPGQIGASEINYNNKTIQINIDPAYSLTYLIAHFELLPGSRAEVGGINQSSDSSDNDFSAGLTYLVTDGIDTSFWNVNVTPVAFGSTDCYSSIQAVEGLNYAHLYAYDEVYDQWYHYTPNLEGLLEINLCEENGTQPFYLYLNVFEDSCNNYTDNIYPFSEYCNNTNNYYFLVKQDTTYLFDLNNYFDVPTNFAWTLKFYPCGAKAMVNWNYTPDNLYLSANANIYTDNDTARYKFEWDLGDGTIIKNMFNIEHLYNGPGLYKAKFIVTNKADQSCSDTAIKEIFIAVPVPIYVSSQYGDDMNGDGSIIKPYSSIDYAIQQAIFGTDIMVLPGVYNEQLYIDNKTIQLKSTNGPENTVISGENYRYYNIELHGNYNPSKILIEGFTLNNAVYNAVNSSGTSLKITNCIISSPEYGVSVYGGESSNMINLDMSHCLIKNCGLGGIWLSYLTGMTNIVNSTIVNNGWTDEAEGAGINIESANAFIQNCIIVNNKTGINYSGPDTITIGSDYNDVWNNFSNYSNVNASIHSISVDPLFTDTLFYYLTHQSPCIDAGNPTFPPDADGTTIDLGYRSNSAIAGVEWVMLKKGWNIYSVYLQPDDVSMLSIVQPLINKDVLIKVMDEQGNAIDKANNWAPNISELLLSEGYKIKLSADDTLIIEGWRANMPFSILLNKGWNIMGYPLDTEQDAQMALDNLIVTNNLIKVQDEKGAAIENINPIGWINNIGNFKPGEGYKVKVLNDAILIINAQILKSKSTNGFAPVPQPVHFKTAWTGNGFDHMNIYFLHDLNPGDEIAVYDGALCVGAGVVTSGDQPVSLVASRDDPETFEKDGFTPGNILKIMIWDATTGKTSIVKNYTCLNDTRPVFEEMGTTVISLISQPTGIIAPELITSLGDNYPNPFKHETKIKYTLSKEEKVTIEIYNLLGERVKVLVDQTMNKGEHNITWNCENENGLIVYQGIYFYTMKAENYNSVKRMILLE